MKPFPTPDEGDGEDGGDDGHESECGFPSIMKPWSEPEALDEMGRTFADEPILKIPKSLLVEFLLALQRQRWRGSVR